MAAFDYLIRILAYHNKTNLLNVYLVSCDAKWRVNFTETHISRKACTSPKETVLYKNISQPSKCIIFVSLLI